MFFLNTVLFLGNDLQKNQGRTKIIFFILHQSGFWVATALLFELILPEYGPVLME